MPYNGSGSFARLYSWVTDKANGIFIDSTRSDNELNGIATGLSNVICKDGQTSLAADIPWNGKKITGYGTTNTPSARSDVPQMGQVQDAKVNWVVAGGTADAITATYAPVITALVDGQECRFRATAANATTTPTFSPNGLTAHTITKNGGSALVAGDIPGALAEVTLRYNLANTRWELGRYNKIAVADVVGATSGTVTSVATAGLATGGAITSTGTVTVTAADAAATIAGSSTTVALTPGGFAASKSLGSNGYYRLPGFIIQWGTATIPANSTSAVNFPLQFPSSAFMVVITGTDVGTNAAVAATPVSTSQFNAHNFDPSTTLNFSWIAFGN